MPKPSPCFYETSLRNCIFSNEKIFKVTQLLNVQNDRTFASSAYNKSTIENKRLYVERSGFTMSLMVSVAVSKVGKSSIFFVEPEAKVNGAYYREKLIALMIPEMDRLTGYQPYVIMQDRARSHTANETVRFLNQQRYLTLKTLRGVPDGPQRSFFWRPALLIAESFLILLLCVKVLCQFNMDWVNWIFFLKK